MTTINKYMTKKGEKRYKFNLYLGIDPKTGRKKRTTRRGFKTQKEAKLEIARLQLELENGGIKYDSNITFKEVYDEFLSTYKLTVRGGTFKAYQMLMQHNALPVFGELRISKITAKDLQKFVNQLYQKMKSYDEVFSKTKRIFTFAKNHGYIEKNPCDIVTVPHREQTIVNENFYTKQELVEFFKAPYLQQPKHLMQLAYFRLLAFSGIRKGEGLALTWADLDFETKMMKINKTVAKDVDNHAVINPPKTFTSIREIDLDDKTIDILKQWKLMQRKLLLMQGINTMRTNSTVFTKLDHFITGASANMWLRSIYKSSPQLKKITVHGFRHTHASLLFSAGVPVKVVQERLGHSTYQMTMDIYTHVAKSEMKLSALKLSDYADF